MRRRRLLTPLVVGLVAALAVPLTAGAAQAASLTIGDAPNDVRRASITGSFEVIDEDTPPGTSPDITSFTINHAPRQVTLQLRFASLARPTGDQALVAGFTVRGDNRQSREVSVVAVPDRPFGRINSMERSNNGQPVCGGALSSRVDYQRSTITVSFPRRCLNGPGRVRVSGGALLLSDADSAAVSITYDDALRTGGSVDTFGTRFSPWVRRG